MTHRLLASLVISSTVLLEGAALVGCGGGATTATEPDRSSANGPMVGAGGVGAGGEAPPASNGGTLLASLPACDEVGWPTTKGGTCEVDASGIDVCTNGAGVRVCVAQPAPTPVAP